MTREDIRYAEELGYRIKLLGIPGARPRDRAARHPRSSLRAVIANVEGV